MSTMVKRKLSLSLCPKRFFKVFLPDKSSHHMKFPSAFVGRFDGTIPFKSTIVSPKSSWQVHVEKIGDNLYFRKGWEQFVQHNSLEFGDFLVFSYNGNTIFRVKIYGRNGCEKGSTCHAEESCRVLPLVEENQIVEKRNSKALDYAAITGRFEKPNSASKEASKFKSDCPFFKLVMQPSYVERGTLNIPARFVNRHMSHTESNKHGITLVYLDKSWRVTLYRSKQTVCKLSAGWLRFSKDNALKAGDVCVFELVDGNHDVFKISIFRCSN